ncbi:MAG: HipA N-terminal domain-containing protein, partial [Leptospiraceae bacterium]|nr:HipA N-terminal domain-containing protein [Leptospiraceae bacterium]
MARAAQLYAFMNGQRVGTLQQTVSGGLEFQYVQEWLDSNIARPISLSLPLASETDRGSPVIDFFDNLLPESGSIRNRIRELLSAASTETFELLSAVGGDCVGALQLLPPARTPKEEQRSMPLSNHGIALRLKNIRTDPLGMRKEEDFRISLAGVQSKTALLSRDSLWHIPLGSTPTSHTFKFHFGKK